MRSDDVLCWPFSEDGNYNYNLEYQFQKVEENSDFNVDFANHDRVLERCLVFTFSK